MWMSTILCSMVNADANLLGLPLTLLFNACVPGEYGLMCFGESRFTFQSRTNLVSASVYFCNHHFYSRPTQFPPHSCLSSIGAPKLLYARIPNRSTQA